jgi:hypothetical protein
MMPRFRKKPVVIEAFEYDGTLGSIPAAWWAATFIGSDGALYIKTLEGDMRAEKGDWLIMGIKGEMYPCKPDIFAATYEPA